MFEIFYECGIVERIVMMNALRPMLVERYPRAHDAILKLRDDLGRRVHEPGQFARFMYLCQALDEAEPLVRWLETYEFKDRMLELVVRDASVYGFAVRASAEASLARRIDVAKVEASTRAEFETMRADGTARSSRQSSVCWLTTSSRHAECFSPWAVPRTRRGSTCCLRPSPLSTRRTC